MKQNGSVDCVSLKDKNGKPKKKYISSKTGRPQGRPAAEYPLHWKEVYMEWKNGNIKAVEAIKQLSITKNTFYNLVKRYENQ